MSVCYCKRRCFQGMYRSCEKAYGTFETIENFWGSCTDPSFIKKEFENGIQDFHRVIRP